MDILFSKGAGIIFLMSSRRKISIQPHEFSITENFGILYNISHFLYTKSRIGAIAWFRFCFSLYSFIYFFFAARSRLRTPCLLILSRTDISDVVYPSHNSITTSRSLPESRCVQYHNRESSIWASKLCQRQFEIVGKRRRNFVVFRRGGNKIKCFLAQKACSRFAVSGA